MYFINLICSKKENIIVELLKFYQITVLVFSAKIIFY